MSLTINVDMDGVLYDFHSEAARLARNKGLDVAEPHEWNMGIPDFSLHFPGFVEKGVFLTGDPIEGARDAIARLSVHNRIRIVTHKVFPDADMTAIAVTDATDWLKRHGFLSPVIELAFTNSYGKQGYEADVVIDDKPTLEWAQPNADLNILFDQPWNQHVTSAMTQKGIIRQRNWTQIVRNIEGIVTVL